MGDHTFMQPGGGLVTISAPGSEPQAPTTPAPTDAMPLGGRLYNGQAPVSDKDLDALLATWGSQAPARLRQAQGLVIEITQGVPELQSQSLSTSQAW